MNGYRNRYGPYHAPNCECNPRFTCRACLDNAPKYFWTPNRVGDTAQRQQHNTNKAKD